MQRKKLTSLVKDDWKKLVRVLEKSQEDANLGYSIVGTTCGDDINLRCAYIHVAEHTSMSTHTPSSTSGCKQHDGIAQKLDVGLQRYLLLSREFGLGRVEGQSMQR